MDLLQTVRKEGSRGGRAVFSWDEVKTDAHRENYLGHSLMAPVGRWQKSKDLSWYTRADDAGDDEERRKANAAQVRRDEIKKVKEAEEEALARALGYEVPDRTEGKGADGRSGNPNLTKLGSGGGKEAMKSVKEDLEGEDEGDREGGRGLGFGSYSGAAVGAEDGEGDVLEGTGPVERSGARSKRESRDAKVDGRRSDDRHRRRSRSRDRDRERHHRSRPETEHRRDRSQEGTKRRRHGSRSRSRSRTRRRRSRSRERRDRDHRDGERHNERERPSREYNESSRRDRRYSDRERDSRDHFSHDRREERGHSRDRRHKGSRRRSASPGDYRRETRERRRYS